MVNKNIALFGLITVLSLLSGCFLLSSKFGPGYIVSINITYNTVLSNDDIVQLDAVAKSEQFNRVKEVKYSNEERTVYYYRELSGKDFDLLHYKFIDIYFIYKNDNLVEIRMLNDWAGYREPLKGEIDRIANIFMRTLAGRIDVKDMHIERSRTGPPF